MSDGLYLVPVGWILAFTSQGAMQGSWLSNKRYNFLTTNSSSHFPSSYLTCFKTASVVTSSKQVQATNNFREAKYWKYFIMNQDVKIVKLHVLFNVRESMF